MSKKYGVFQSYNNRTDAWVKYKVSKDEGSRIQAVKKSSPTKPFKNVPIRR